ncbi:hypothetical protein FOL47_003168 [Perkinsus chesapeaki]|uniref:Uncharacterized protein n=1 Tax=Perkinsus chesapeaki TaxID=330153 RepID=A0A7J6M9B0_PERCH|nr:hypothetical protein FOL47_003168 [Perkinsus chesapeaki]
MPEVAIDAIGTPPDIDSRHSSTASLSTQAARQPKKRASSSQTSRASRKAQRRDGANDTLLRLMRGEEILEASCMPLDEEEEDALRIGGEANPTSEVSSVSLLESSDTVPSNLSDLHCFDAFDAHLEGCSSGLAHSILDTHMVPFDLFGHNDAL